MSAKEKHNQVYLLFNEYGMASTDEIACAVNCLRGEVWGILGVDKAQARDAYVLARRDKRIDDFIVSCMAQRIGKKERVA